MLRLYPSPAGVQLDACRESRFGFAWTRARQELVKNAILHPSVPDSFKLPAVLHHDEMKPYRPDSPREHEQLAQYYESPAETPSEN